MLKGVSLDLGFVLKNEVGGFVDPLGQFRSLVEVNKHFYDTTKMRPRGNWT
jgi:hypothetical protein